MLISVQGGAPLPLFVDGASSARDWAAELRAHSAAPYVQFMGTRAMITLPAEVHAQTPVRNPRATLAAIDEVLALQDELSGFDGSDERHQPTPLRTHYLVDFRASEQARESFYMYASDHFIGMLPDNTADLTDPARLRREWGIWHENRHTHQQNSWTWEALAEVNVNLYSLYVQEHFGQASTLAMSEDDAPSFLDQAREYLEAGADDLLEEVSDEDDAGFFIRLVLFHQLKEAYGWELFQDLNRHFREHPLSAEASDQDKADAMVQAFCDLTDNDLRAFFSTWGLQLSPRAIRAIQLRGYPPPEQDPAEIF